MGAPGSDMQAAEQPDADSLLGALKTIKAADRARHAGVLNYWLSIRGDKEFPSLHDLDPLQLSDAAPCSILLELISGGHDAEIRHIGEALKAHGVAERMIDAPRPSILASIAAKLPIVAISRDYLAFEDEWPATDGTTRCWVTLLPLSAGGAWVDYVYALVSVETVQAKAAKSAKTVEASPEVAESIEEAPAEAEVVTEEAPVEAEVVAEEAPVEAEAVADPVEAEELESPPEDVEPPVEAVAEADEPESPDPIRATAAKIRPGFSKLIAGLGGFYSQSVKFEPTASPAPPRQEPVVDEPPAEDRAAEQPADEPPVEEVFADEPAVEEFIADEPPVEESIAGEPPVEQQLADEQPAEEPVADEHMVEDQMADQPPAEEELIVEAPAAEPAEPPTRAAEGNLHSKLAEVRTKADEARMAKLRANAALYEGLGAAYDFALDAENAPEEYLRLVEAQGLKIQLRSPMTPVVKLAFDGLCDESTIGQLEAVLAWALEQDLPRGSLPARIEDAGGVARILSGDSQAA
jgi:hypothetical protein